MTLECSDCGVRGVDLVCETCGKQITRRPAYWMASFEEDVHFCSKKCSRKFADNCLQKIMFCEVEEE